MIFFTQEKALCYPDIYNSVHHPTAIEWIHDIHALIFPAATRRRQGGRLTRPRNNMRLLWGAKPCSRHFLRSHGLAPIRLFCSARLPGVTHLTEPLRSDDFCHLPFAAYWLTSRPKMTSYQSISVLLHDLFQTS